MTSPENLTQHQALRLAKAITAGFAELMQTALEESTVKHPEHQWALLQPILTEADEHARVGAVHASRPAAPYHPSPVRRHDPPRAHSRRLAPPLH